MTVSNILLDLSDAAVAIVEKAARGVVAVQARSGASSSGILLRSGIVVTADETVEVDDGIEVVLPDGRTIAAALAGRDPTTDITVFRVEGSGPVDAFPDAAPSRPGALVFAVGRAGLATLSAMGTVALVGEAWRSSHGGMIDAFLRFDIHISRAVEGGAILDASGAFVGMAVFGPRRRVIAIPASTIRRVVDRILAHGSVARGYVGLGVEPVKIPAESGNATRGAIVVSIDQAGPGRTAGVILGDILVRWNGEPIDGPRGLVNRLGPESVGENVRLGIVRAGAEHDLTLKVAERPKT
jgi:S1-C subfamily serine protease